MLYINGRPTFTSPVIQGTVGAGTGLTLPAFTAGGNITLGANILITDNMHIKEDPGQGGRLVIWNLAETELRDLRLRDVHLGRNIRFDGNGGSIDGGAADANYFIIRARDTGVGYVEIGRGVGAADPYFQIGHFRLNPVATASLPATPVEGMLYYDDTANKLKIYNGSAWETVSSA